MKSKVPIPCKFQNYRENGYLIDCVIRFPEKDCPVHRLVLAKYSAFFRRLFAAGSSNDMFTFVPEFNPQNSLMLAVDFLYTGTVAIDASNVVAILATAEHYEIPILAECAASKYAELATEKTALTFAKQCVEYGVSEINNKVVPIIADHFNSWPREKLFGSMNASFLAEVLLLKVKPESTSDEVLSCRAKSEFTSDEVLSIIDQFHETTPVKDENEMEKLARTIDWTSSDAYMFLARHKCRWVPPRIGRPLYRKMMAARRRTYYEWQKRAMQQNEASESSRWFTLAWAQEVRNATGRVETTSNLIRFASTLGSDKQPLPPTALGTIQIDGSPATQEFAVDYAFDGKPDTYFMSILEDEHDRAPFVSFKFGQRASFVVDSLKFVCRTEKVIEMKLKKILTKSDFDSGGRLIERKANIIDSICPVPLAIEVTGFNEDGRPSVPPVTIEAEALRRATPVQTHWGLPISKIHAEIRKPDGQAVAVLRLIEIEVVGKFVT